MRRITVLAGAGVVAFAVGAISFMAGRALTASAPVAPRSPAPPVAAHVPEPELVTGSTAARPVSSAAPTQSRAPAVPVAFAPPAGAAMTGVSSRTNPPAPPMPSCANRDGLGVSRTVEVDTTGGPGFGFEQFKAYDFLEPGEVVLTFDDGPWPGHTPAVLAALAAQCVKATFFPIGEHAIWHPEILKQVVAQGHTVGSHTWSHADLSKKPLPDAKDEIENGISAVAATAGRPLAPFFRFPDLRQTPDLTAYLGGRNIGIFSTDIDSFDFKIKDPQKVVASVMSKLQKRGKGIILMHDFQRSTAMGLPDLLTQLKAGGYKIVWVKAKDIVTTLPQYDAAMSKALAGQTIDARPTASVVRTISNAN
jgi:peptidoglycan/xylan/chitin deacetylase (PgdA/CDA1 family)